MDRYDSYKDSGVEWIGEIPRHWMFIPIKYTLAESKDSIRTGPFGSSLKSDEFVDEGVRVYNQRSVYDEDFSRSEVFVTQEKYQELKSFEVLPKDVLITSRGTIGRMTIVPKDGEIGVLHPCLIRLRLNGDRLYDRYLWNYVNQSSLFLESVMYESNSTTIEVIYSDTLSNVKFPVPPINEQNQIVSFLDTKTSLIDTMIEKTQRKIDLLKEQRTSLINEVVTKGLNPDVVMKDSGVEWIGEIPSHWVTTKLGLYTTKVGSGSTPRGGSEIYVETGIPFIRSQNVHFDGLKLDNVSFIEHDVHDSMKGSVVVKNDVLLNITGGSIGRCCVVNIDGEMNVNQHVSIIRTKEKLLNYFLNYIISCDVGQSQVRYNLTGGNREGLTIEGIKDFQISLPPLQEQNQIVEYLDNETQLIDTTISKEKKRIELLKEYRQSLISEVVTGKIKVSEV